MSDALQPYGLQHARRPCHQLPEFTQTHVHWVSDAIQPSHPLLLPPSIFPSIRVFSNQSQLFASGGQSIGVSASTSVLPMNIQDWFPVGWTGLRKGLSILFIFSKNQLLVSLIFCIVFFTSISFISALIFMNSFFLLTLFFLCSAFSFCFRCKVWLFIWDFYCFLGLPRWLSW